MSDRESKQKIDWRAWGVLLWLALAFVIVTALIVGVEYIKARIFWSAQ